MADDHPENEGEPVALFVPSSPTFEDGVRAALEAIEQPGASIEEMRVLDMAKRRVQALLLRASEA